MTRALTLLSALLLYSLTLVSSAHAYAYPGNTTLVSRGWFGSGSDGDPQQAPASQGDASAPASSSSSSGSKTANVGEEIINFLQVMFEGGIKSQQCWITLVNATQSDLGSCLGLSTFSSLIVQGSEGSFATGVDTYLTGMCGGTKCSTETLKYWKYKIQGDCNDDMEQPLLKTLNVVMNSYETSLYDLACKVHFNGTAGYCLSEVLNATQTTNSKDFFTNIITGMNVNWYDQSFFGQQLCTGCMHELYKAAMFLIPSIRTWSEMITLGGTLSTCQAGENIAWKDICDQQKPACLSVEAATPMAGAATRDKQQNVRAVLLGVLAAVILSLIL